MGPLKRVLIVDAHTDTVETLSTLLTLHECCCVGVETGRAAITMACVFDPHVVLLELVLPDMSGFDVVQQLRRGYAKRRIIVVSGWYLPGIAMRVLAAGADAYRLKPLHLDQIVPLVHNFSDDAVD